MKFRQPHDGPNPRESARRRMRLCLAATAVCLAGVAGCTGRWQLVDLRSPDRLPRGRETADAFSHGNEVAADSQWSDDSNPVRLASADLPPEPEAAEPSPFVPEPRQPKLPAAEISEPEAPDVKLPGVESFDPKTRRLEPPDAKPPVTEPPITEPPITEPPVTEPSITEPSITELPFNAEGLGSVAEETFSIEEVLDYAASRNPLLRARKHEVEVARGKLIAAGLLPNPELILKTDSPVSEDDASSLTTRVMYTIPFGGKLRHKKSVACTAIQRARLAVEKETEDVLRTTAEAALQVLYLQELALEYDQLDSVFELQVKKVENRYNAGPEFARFADVIETELDATGYRLAHKQTDRELTAARVRLCRAMGMRTPVRIRIAGEFLIERVPDVPLETLLAVARESDPVIASSHLAVTSSQRKLALAHSEAKPDPEIGPWYESQFGEPKDTIGGRFNLELPFFDRNQGDISGAAAQIHVDRALSEVTELNTLNDVAAAYRELMHIQSSLDFYEAFISQRKQYDIGWTQEEMLAQAIEINQVLDVLRKLSVMKIKGLTLRYQHNLLRMRLELALGMKLQDLVHRPEPAPIAGDYFR